MVRVIHKTEFGIFFLGNFFLSFLFLKDVFICFKERKRERACMCEWIEGQRKRRQNPQATPHWAQSLRQTRSRPEPKPVFRCITDWATQALLSGNLFDHFNSISLMDIGLFGLSISYSVSFTKLCFLRDFLILIKLSYLVLNGCS